MASSLVLIGVQPVIVHLLLFGKSFGCTLVVSHTTATVTCDVAQLKGKILAFRVYYVCLHQGDLSYDKTIVPDNREVRHPRSVYSINKPYYIIHTDRLCGLVVRVSGYRYRGLGFDSRRYQIF